mmetsp:Transcript_44911/g.53991  ORF Transcript_44911/g.53991 Transcript_44911/m.53991 type:complete len:102 (+) Transcript_44911:420-725(+)
MLMIKIIAVVIPIFSLRDRLHLSPVDRGGNHRHCGLCKRSPIQGTSSLEDHVGLDEKDTINGGTNAKFSRLSDLPKDILRLGSAREDDFRATSNFEVLCDL